MPRVEWAPAEWQTPHYQPSLPRVTRAQLERVCSGVHLHAARPEWLLQLADRERWEPGHEPSGSLKYAVPLNGAGHSEARARCVGALASFRPRVCSKRDVFVWGQAKHLFSPTNGTVYAPLSTRLLCAS